MNRFTKILLVVLGCLLAGVTINAADALLKGTALQLTPTTIPTKGTNGELRVNTSTKKLQKYDATAGATAWFNIHDGYTSGGPNNIYSTAYGDNQFLDFGGFIGRRALGTLGSPTAVSSGRTIATFGAAGYGDTGFSSTSKGGMRVLGAETWTDSAQGTILHLQTTPTGSTTPATALTVSAAGIVSATNDVSAPSYTSTVATGTAPFTVASTTQVANLNAATAGTAADLSATLAIAKGGTGQTTEGTARNALNKIPDYITNGRAEVDTTGWATHNDAAATSPVNGTGGSSSVTFTRTTSSPIRGTGSFLITKDAVNRQGQGASYDFTIDTADQGKVLQIGFDYYVASGTYADSDQTVWIYDVTNSALIQPAASAILNAVGPQKWGGTFQTASNSTSYRLIFHTSSTSAVAYTVQLDNVSVSPQIVTQGAAITDWVAYTPTIVGFGTPTSVTFEWRRVGDSAEIKGRFQSGTSTAVAASISLPNGITTDAAKIPNNANVGEWKTNSTATSGFLFTGGATSNTLSLSIAGGINQNNGSAIAASGGWVIFNSFLIPITGWSSNVNLSSDTDTRVVALYRSTLTGTTLTNGASTAIPFGTAGVDTHGAWSTDTYTVPVSGKYEVDTTIFLAARAYSAGDVAQLRIEIAGSEVEKVYLKNADTTNTIRTMNGSGIWDMTAGQTIKIKVRVDNGSGDSAIDTNFPSSISVKRLSGPATIAASESVNFAATGSTTSFTTTGTALVPTTVTKNTHGMIASATLTIPVSGTYMFGANLSTTTATTYIQLWYSKNGAAKVQIASFQGSSTTYNSVSGSKVLPLLAGDTIEFIGVASTSVTADNVCDLYLTKVGNY